MLTRQQCICIILFVVDLARWFSWLECRPVTAEVEGSSPFRVAKTMPRQLSWQSKGLKIPVSTVRFCAEAPHYAGIAQWQSTSLPRRGSRVRASFPAPNMATQPSGKAEVCKTFIPGSIPGVASIFVLSAAVAELADARDLKSLGSNTVPVRFRSAAPNINIARVSQCEVHWDFFVLWVNF